MPFRRSCGQRNASKNPRELTIPAYSYLWHLRPIISRNVVNILLYVAEQCKGYYPVSEIADMLSTFVPRITKEVCIFGLDAGKILMILLSR